MYSTVHSPQPGEPLRSGVCMVAHGDPDDKSPFARKYSLKSMQLYPVSIGGS